MSVIRFRGDTHPLQITLKKDGTLLDLSTISSAELAIRKKDGVSIIICTKDADDLTGKVYADMNSSIVDDSGTFPFDVQILWLDTTKTTFIRDEIIFKDDINKT